jgi:hypothetical protein
MVNAEHDVYAVVAQIRRYLAAHPLASDSRLGVQRWWIESSGIEVTADLTQRALDILTASGEADKKTLRDGTVMYFVRRADAEARGY